MDKCVKKRLKSSETKNEKHKNNTRSETKESKNLLWSRFKTLFTKKITTNPEKNFEKNSQNQPNMVNNGAIDVQGWSPPEDPADSQKLNIPIGPGRQVSTVVLSPTETGFQAVIAHYEDSAKLSESMSKDLTNMSEIKNRRTFTLVFNMEQGKFREIGVGKSESGEEYDERRRNGTNISMSEIYVRNNADQLMESTTLMQAQLPFEHLRTDESSAFAAEPTNFDLEKKQPSCRSIRRARVAFKTLSEPMSRDKHALYEDLIVKQNVEEMLNHIIFLERDPSLMGYVREYSELGPAELTTIYGEEQQLTMPVREVTASNSSQYRSAESLTKFLQTTSVSSRTVAPDLLVNIKPFKEYIRGGKTEGVSQMDDRESMNHPRSVLRTKERNLELRLMDKGRPPPCLRCGLKQKSSEQISSSCTTQFSKGPRTLTPANNDSCNLCSIRKTYRKSNLRSLDFVRDSLDDVLKELYSYDHETTFRKNLSLFKSYLINQSETKKSSSYLSVTEIIKLEGENMTPKEVHDGLRNEHRIEFKCVETLRKKGEKIIKFHSQEKAIERLKLEALPRFLRVRILENSSLFILSPITVKPKVMAQIVQENMIQVCHFANRIIISKECITVTPEAFLRRSKLSNGVFSKRHSEKCFSEFQLYNKKPIMDVINQLLRTKVEDLRNELLTRLNETKLSYEKQLQEQEKIQRKCLTSGVCRGDTSQPFAQKSKDVNFKPEVGSSDNWVRINDRILEVQQEPVGLSKKENVGVMEDKSTLTCAPVLTHSAKTRYSSVIKPPLQEIPIETDLVMHSIPTLKGTAECRMETARSCREFQKKNQPTGTGVRSELTENPTQENGRNSVKDSKTSRKKMAVVESRNNMNHFPDTSKGNLTTGVGKKTEIGNCGTGEETTNEILHRNNCASLLLFDDCEVRLLYYNRPKYQEACSSSVTSNYSDSLRKDQKESNSSTVCDLTLGEMDNDTYSKPPLLEANKTADLNERTNNLLNAKTDKPSPRPWETNLTNKDGESESDAKDGIGAESQFSFTKNQGTESTLRPEPESMQKKPNNDLMPQVKAFGEFADAKGKDMEHFAHKEAAPKGNTKRISVTVMLMKKWGEKTRSSIPTRCASTVKSK